MTTKRATPTRVRRKLRKQKWDLDHQEAIEELDHCPCWYAKGICCFCGQEQEGCQGVFRLESGK